MSCVEHIKITQIHIKITAAVINIGMAVYFPGVDCEGRRWNCLVVGAFPGGDKDESFGLGYAGCAFPRRGFRRKPLVAPEVAPTV